MSKNLKILKNRLVSVPDHVAIIPDGNRRWARARSKDTFWGHKHGFDLTPRLMRFARDLGIHTMTIWAFSTENWNRKKKEVNYLMKLYGSMFDEHLRDAHKDKVKIVHLGRKDRIPKFLLKKLLKAEKETANYDKYILNIALDYGGHDEINRAIGRLVDEIKAKKQLVNEAKAVSDNFWEDVIDKYANKYPIYRFANYLDTSGQPYPFPDFMIRTSGEHRTSGLLTWQSAYTELYFADVHFPAFDEDHFYEALEEFARRRRRFGGNDVAGHLQFKPEKVAKLETDTWKALFANDYGKAAKSYEGVLKELFHGSNGKSAEAARLFVEARLRFLQLDFKAGNILSKKYYVLLKELTGFCFDVDVLATLLSDYEKVLLNSTDKFHGLADNLMVELMSESFRINHLQATKAGHLKWLAEKEFVLGMNTREVNMELARDYLLKSYEGLREMVA